MERRYTTGVIRQALRGTPGCVSKTRPATDWEKGIFTANKYGQGNGGGRGFLGATVFDVQTWLARRNLTAPEWLLRKVLDDAAAEILENGPGNSKRFQRHLDRETGYAETV